MTPFFTALTFFFLAHIVPARPGARTALIRLLRSEQAYLIFYSLLSIIMLAWVIWASIAAPYIPLWTPPSWAYHIPILVMPVAIILLSGAVVQPNPLSISFVSGPFDPAHPGILAVTRHPVLWSFGLWALSHIPPNGSLVGVLLFAIFAGFAFAGMTRLERKKRLTLGTKEWARLSAGTSIVPLAALVHGRATFPRSLSFILSLVLGLIVYFLILFYAHAWLFGVAPLDLV